MFADCRSLTVSCRCSQGFQLLQLMVLVLQGSVMWISLVPLCREAYSSLLLIAYK